MELWVGALLAVLAVVVVDWLFRRFFRQEGDRTVGARQRGPQTDWKRHTGEVINEVTKGDARDDRPDY